MSSVRTNIHRSSPVLLNFLYLSLTFLIMQCLRKTDNKMLKISQFHLNVLLFNNILSNCLSVERELVSYCYVDVKYCIPDTTLTKQPYLKSKT